MQVDAQGALALLPAYQVGLLLALGMTLAVGWWRLLWALGVLLLTQVAFLVVLGELAGLGSLLAHALFLRAWAVAVPVALALALFRAGQSAAGGLAPLLPAADAPR